jgi:hypothetical protein
LPPCCGAVTFLSTPWSRVYVDGVVLEGRTPIRTVEITAGRHEALFVNPKLRRSRRVTFHVTAGKTHRVEAELRPGIPRPEARRGEPRPAADAGPE